LGHGVLRPAGVPELRETKGRPLSVISTAITVHFLIGAVIGANLPEFHRRFGAATVTKAGALCLATGVLGWAGAAAPWQLSMPSMLSGAGWGGMSAFALYAIVSPWFVRTRPAALAMAYNGGSVGGVIFSPLWVKAIGTLGFSIAAAAISLVMVFTVGFLADHLFSRTPQHMGLWPDGDFPSTPAPSTPNSSISSRTWTRLASLSTKRSRFTTTP